MCYNAPVSYVSFLVIFSISLILSRSPHHEYRALYLFILGISLIQLIEGLHHSKILNSNVTGKYLYITLWTQIIFLYYGIALNQSENISTNKHTFYTLFALVLFILVLWKANEQEKDGDYTVIENQGHLSWSCCSDNPSVLSNSKSILPGYQSVLYAVSMLVGLILVWKLSHYSGKIGILILYGIVSFFIVHFKYPAFHFATMWCFAAIGFALLTLVFNNKQ